jgi:hypothetical protein
MAKYNDVYSTYKHFSQYIIRTINNILNGIKIIMYFITAAENVKDVIKLKYGSELYKTKSTNPVLLNIYKQ